MLILILGIAEIPKLSKQLDDNYLALTYNVVLVLAKTLLYTAYEFNVFLDNLFTNLKLFCQLRQLGIGACGTAWANVVSPLFGSSHETWKPQLGTLWAREHKEQTKEKTTKPGVLVALWQDNAVVKLATTIHQGTEWVVQERKKPKDTSSLAAIVKVPFKAFPKHGAQKPTQTRQQTKEYVHVRPLPIPKWWMTTTIS